jgi:chemotaxis protein CheD
VAENSGSKVLKANTKSVRMGEIAIGRGHEPIKTLLGSCIGLALYDWSHHVGGLAHIVLPSSQGHVGLPGKFVDTAIPELIRQIEELDGDAKKLSAKLVGGANMFNSTTGIPVGDRNLDATKQLLKEYRIPLVASHCGETFGRRMTFFPGSGRVLVDVVGCETIEI